MAFIIDTNVLLRLIVPNDPMHPAAVNACSLMISAGEELFAFPQNISEFWNVCTRPVVNNGLGYSTVKANVEINALSQWVTVIPEHIDTYAEWRDLIVKHKVRGVKTHDARLAAAIIAQGLDSLVTFNAKDFKRFTTIKVFTPADILAKYSRKVGK